MPVTATMTANGRRSLLHLMPYGTWQGTPNLDSSTASGPVSLAQERARLTLADSTTFRTLVGAAGQAAALTCIYHDGLPPPANGSDHSLAELQGYRPFAIVWTHPDNGHVLARDSGGLGGSHQERGVILIDFEWDVATALADDRQAIALQAHNAIGNIKKEMLALAGEYPYLDIMEIRQAGYYRTRAQDVPRFGDAVSYQLECHWGSPA